MKPTAALLTARTPGAIGLIVVEGIDRLSWERISSAALPDVGVPSHVHFHDQLGEFDDGVVARITASRAYLMPHGGVRIATRLLAALDAAGATIDHEPAPATLEEAMLDALARAASPLAVDLLLDQPRRHADSPPPTADDLARSARLDRLIVPPTVVLFGAPNIGKSTLTNRLAGRTVAIAADHAGTTRDHTRTRLDLGGLVVDWIDTAGRPGRDKAASSIEQRAIDLDADEIGRSDLLIAVADAESEWIETDRPADLRVGLRGDLGPRNGADLTVSARTGDGLEALVAACRARLVPPADLAHPGPWWFNPPKWRAPGLASPPNCG